jgi:hypothetical protein
MIYKLDTGHKPAGIEDDQIDKKGVFNMFAMTRFLLRKGIKSGKELKRRRDELMHIAGVAVVKNDRMMERAATERAEKIERYLEGDHEKYLRSLALNVLLNASLIDRVATFEEKSALVSVSPIAMRRALALYARHGKSESLSMLLQHMPDSHPDHEVSDYLLFVITDEMASNSVLRRQAAQKANEVLGQSVCEVPQSPPLKPVHK